MEAPEPVPASSTILTCIRTIDIETLITPPHTLRRNVSDWTRYNISSANILLTHSRSFLNAALPYRRVDVLGLLPRKKYSSR